MSELTQVVSPCVSNCCLDDKDMCVGCFRMMDEILVWAESDNQQRKLILASCEKRRAEHKNYFSP
ncbi:DUF1289 domain-containing protein [Paraglaciecola sp.]|uniref:DUF1289 domain-containing protein n=1 Tax=Paraglaciecola sp. TaxID=1920173 RepID=UPI003EF0FF52